MPLRNKAGIREGSYSGDGEGGDGGGSNNDGSGE